MSDLEKKMESANIRFIRSEVHRIKQRLAVLEADGMNAVEEITALRNRIIELERQLPPDDTNP